MTALLMRQCLCRRSAPATRDGLTALRSSGGVAWSSTSSSPTPRLASDAYTSANTEDTSQPSLAATSTTPNLPPHHRNTLSSLLRVDHSGEIAANTIYQAQALVFRNVRRDASSTDLIMDMWENEKKHLKVAEMLLAQHRVRPSALNAVWGALGSALGATTALMGREAAMACTEAVETVIGEHYDDQISHLDEVIASFPAADGQLSGEQAKDTQETARASLESLRTLRSLLEEFRDDELEHLDTAVEHDAQQAPAHALLSAVVQMGCKGAIEVAKKI
ncbi:unnamed protein product [Parajaminaea phylloscopi]